MALLSVREAARLLSVDERTIRRWIENKRLASQQGVNGRLLIDEGEIERVRLELQAGPPPQQTLDLGLLMAKVELMQSEMELMRQRIEDLEARAGPREKKHIAPPASGAGPDVTHTSSKSLPLWPETNAEGLIPLQQLADELGVTRSTIMGHLAQGHYQDTTQGARHLHFFTPEQAEQARRYHESIPPGKRGKQ